MQALLHVLLVFRLHLHGFTNRDLRDSVSSLLGSAQPLTTTQATYDLRRLRHHGLIERIPHSHRYRVTSNGLRYALFLTRAHDRLLRTGLAEITGIEPTRLRTAANAYDKALDQLTYQAALAA